MFSNRVYVRTSGVEAVGWKALGSVFRVRMWAAVGGALVLLAATLVLVEMAGHARGCRATSGGEGRWRILARSCSSSGKTSATKVRNSAAPSRCGSRSLMLLDY